MKILFVMNPKAGTKKAQKYLADILGEFCGAGHTVITHVTAGPGDAIQAVIRYSKEVDLVVCCGGDGTFNETVNGIMQCGIHVLSHNYPGRIRLDHFRDVREMT